MTVTASWELENFVVGTWKAFLFGKPTVFFHIREVKGNETVMTIVDFEQRYITPFIWFDMTFVILLA